MTFPASTSASGIWTLRDALRYKAAGQWPRGPVAPTSLAGTPGDEQVALTWTAPATTHGTITDYIVEYTPAAGSPTVVATGSTAVPYTLTGLTNDTEYTFRVAAVNHTRGDWSSSVAVTPSPVPPDPDWANVTMLLHADNSVADTSDNNVQLDAWTNYGAGRFGSGSFAFAGETEGVYRATDTLQLTSSEFQPWTVEMWFKTGVSANPQVLFTNSSIVLQLFDNGSVTTSQGAASITSGTGYDDDDWHHVAVVKDSSRRLWLYVDGVYINDDFASFQSPSGDYISIGYWPTAGRLFTGLIDEVRVTTVQRYVGASNFTPPTAAFPDA